LEVECAEEGGEGWWWDVGLVASALIFAVLCILFFFGWF
jgi:hypothetical protein